MRQCQRLEEDNLTEETHGANSVLWVSSLKVPELVLIWEHSSTYFNGDFH